MISKSLNVSDLPIEGRIKITPVSFDIFSRNQSNSDS